MPYLLRSVRVMAVAVIAVVKVKVGDQRQQLVLPAVPVDLSQQLGGNVQVRARQPLPQREPARP